MSANKHHSTKIAKKFDHKRGINSEKHTITNILLYNTTHHLFSKYKFIKILLQESTVRWTKICFFRKYVGILFDFERLLPGWKRRSGPQV